jgi:DNA-binding NarL/FixJ family response regulator
MAAPDTEKKTRIAKILIIDDHPIMRQGLRDTLKGQPDLEVVDEAECTRSAMKKLASSRFDLIILDLSFRSGPGGLDLIKDIRARDHTTKILVFSMHDEMLYAERVIRAGAQGFLNKEVPTAEVLKAVRRVLKGELYLSKRMSDLLLRRTFDKGRDSHTEAVSTLSDREIEVLELIGRGLRSTEIAERLCLSVKTIETHRQNMKRKLNLESGTLLVRYAVNWVESGGRSLHG